MKRSANFPFLSPEKLSKGERKEEDTDIVKPFVFKALKVSEPSSSPSPLITLSNEKATLQVTNYYGRFKGSLTTENLMEEEGKGRHLIYLKYLYFRQFQSFGRDWGRKKKGRGFYHKDSSRQQGFLFGYAENDRFFTVF
ncbi:MAG: hypothetical protein HDR05_05455 [Lachnospiraceae bacterium]|nr:hypothetical protein [Lachnospiraceae bacterium]